MDIHGVPWHVSIYKNNNSTYELHCSGTIVLENIVISSIGCFYDHIEKKLFNLSLFKIAAGKTFSEFAAEEDKETVQFLEVARLRYPPHINFSKKTPDAVAVVLKSNINFTANVAPICFENENEHPNGVPIGMIGFAPTWDVSNRALKMVRLNSVNKTRCGLVKGTISNEFCVGNVNTTVSIYREDRGGGWIYLKEVQNKTKYYLRGIVQIPDSIKNIFQSGFYHIFTIFNFGR